MICNYIHSLPRCQEGSVNEASLQSEPGLVAKQTQHIQLEVGELGYLSSQYTSGATTILSSITLSLTIIVLCLPRNL